MVRKGTGKEGIQNGIKPKLVEKGMENNLGMEEPRF